MPSASGSDSDSGDGGIDGDGGGFTAGQRRKRRLQGEDIIKGGAARQRADRHADGAGAEVVLEVGAVSGEFVDIWGTNLVGSVDSDCVESLLVGHDKE